MKTKLLDAMSDYELARNRAEAAQTNPDYVATPRLLEVERTAAYNLYLALVSVVTSSQ